jgi:hypothetical protein
MSAMTLAVDGGVLLAAVAAVLLMVVLPLWGAADAALRPDLDWGRIERSKTAWVLLQLFLFPCAAYYFMVVRPQLQQSVRERRPQAAYRPPRSRREVGTAIACAASVVVVTSALVWLLRPRGDGGGSSEIPELPPELTSIPTDSSVPPEAVPTETIPPEGTAPPPSS